MSASARRQSAAGDSANNLAARVLLESVATATSTTSIGCGNIGQQEAGSALMESALKSSPKKSIFEGASKDEILTYLEDARERVPELLMAADEVMVIGDNELLLVNQLEPGSPATPISIVESEDIISSGELLGDDEVRHQREPVERASIPISAPSSSAASSSVVLVESCHHHHPLDSSASIEADEIRVFDVKIEGLSDLNEHCEPFADSHHPLLSDLAARRHHHSMTATTYVGLPPSLPLPPLASPLVEQQQQQQKSSLGEQVADLGDQADENGGQRDGARTAAATGARQLFEPSVSSVSEPSGGPAAAAGSSRQPDDEQHEHLCISERVTSMLRRSTRCKSSSENSTQAVSETKRAVRLMMLHQQCHSKTRDSISTSNSSSSSSSSSTPGTSSSSSRSSSSNQTSGNCSGTSNFYTSPSLSCSSPFLAGNAAANQIPSSATHGRSSHHHHPVVFSGNLAQLASATNSLSLVSPPAGGDLVAGSRPFLDTGEQSALQHHFTDQNSDSGFEPESSLRGPSVSFDREFSSQLTDRAPTGPPRGQEIERDLRVAPSSGASVSSAGVGNAGQSTGPASLELHRRSFSGATLPDSCDRASTSKPEVSGWLGGKEFNFVPAKTLATSCNSSRPGPSSSSSGDTKSSLTNLAQRPQRPITSHYATINRLNNYLINRYRSCGDGMGTGGDLSLPTSVSPDGGAPPMVEFQCLDCDQFIVTDHARVLHKANELRLLRESEIESQTEGRNNGMAGQSEQLVSLDQIDRAYVVALNGLPLCHYCEKKRIERKEIISEFLETELKYGRDLKIIHDEFYRPMQIAGLLSKDQINGIFSNLDELIMAHCRFAERIQAASAQAQAIGDQHFNTINIGKLFNESADMLHTFESYCIRQAAAACLLARLAKEKELLRIFLRVSQMENTLLRRMNLAAFLMVPVQRVTKYPLLLNRLYKVTAYHHKDREALRDAQLKVELHLEHINQQTKGISATNKIWRRISNLSGQAITTSRRGLVSAEDIGYIKLRKTAMELLKWDRDETQFIHSGKIDLAPLNEYLVRQKMKSVRYMSAHALLIVLGKPNWKYRPDLVKSHVDYKLLTPTPGANGIREAALLLFREKNGRFVACREPLLLSNCVLSNDCSQFNIETTHTTNQNKQHQLISSSNSGGGGGGSSNPLQQQQQQQQPTTPTMALAAPAQGGGSSTLTTRRSSPCASVGSAAKAAQPLNEFRAASADTAHPEVSSPARLQALSSTAQPMLAGLRREETSSDSKSIQSKSFSSSKESDASEQGDSISMSSLKSLPEERRSRQTSPPPPQASRSYSLASAFPQASTVSKTPLHPIKPQQLSATSNRNMLNPFKSKAVNANADHVQTSKLASPDRGLMRTSTASASSIDSNTSVPTTATATTTNIMIQQEQNPAAAGAALAGNQKGQLTNGRIVNMGILSGSGQQSEQHRLYNHHFFHNHHHHQQPYGDYEESFEIHERLSKESLLLRADTPLKTRYWLQMLRYHAKDLGHWRQRRPALANIMMMRQE